MKLRPSTLEKKTYTFENYDKAFNSIAQKQSNNAKGCKQVLHLSRAQKNHLGYLPKTKKIVKLSKRKNTDEQYQRSKIAQQQNWKKVQGVHRSDQKFLGSKIQDHRFVAKEEENKERQEILSENEE